MKMRRSTARIACISYVAEYVPGIHHVSRLERAVPIQVRVIVHLSARSEDVDDLSSERVGSYAHDNSFRGAKHGRAAFGKDVHALM